jgi:hypothetical protein
MSVYVGIDVHRKRSQVAVVDQDGQVLANRNVPNEVQPILKVIGGLPPGAACAGGAGDPIVGRSGRPRRTDRPDRRARADEHGDRPGRAGGSVRGKLRRPCAGALQITDRPAAAASSYRVEYESAPCPDLGMIGERAAGRRLSAVRTVPPCQMRAKMALDACVCAGQGSSGHGL